LNNLKKISYLSVTAILVFVGFTHQSSAQERQRIVKSISSQPTNQPSIQPTIDKTRSLSSSTPSNSPAVRPTLTNKIVVVPQENKAPLVQKTVSSHSLNGSLASARTVYGIPATAAMQRGIQTRLGIPYRYGSTGPNRFDCSGFVWAVFNDAGIGFTRQSARSLWGMSEPVSGDDRFKFGTLVFLNGLGHIGIVADEKGFYHASSSKGITYSPFKGYWEKRVVGFRRLNNSIAPATVQSSK